MRDIIRFLLPALGATLLSACGTSPEEHFAQAKASFARQDFGATRVAVSAALRERPGDLAMLALLVESQLRLGDPDGAAVTIGKLRAAGANGPGVARYDSEVKLLEGKPAEALALLGSDATADAWRLRARAQIALERPDDAAVSFERGIAVGKDVRLFSDYVWFKIEAGDLPGAKALLERLRAFAPQAMETLLIAGDIAVREGRTDAAFADYANAAKLYPTRFQPLVSQAELFERQGKLDAAIAAAATAAALQPNHPVINLLQLRLEAKQGDWQTIRQWLQPWGDDLDPYTPQAVYYAEALLRLGQPEQARTMLGRVVLLQPDNRHARLLLGEALLTVGDAVAADQTLAPLAEDATPEEQKLIDKAAKASGRV